MRHANRLAPALLALAAGCATPRPAAPPTTQPAPSRRLAASATDGGAERLARLLAGTFDSSDQAARDGEYRTIHLAICPVEAPELGARVLYVEQAVAGALDRPYRQRLYVVEPGADAAEARSRVFELRAPAAATGTCARPLARFTAAEVEERAGCAVTLRWDAEGARFQGATAGRGCTSKLRGAAYATSEVTLDAARLVSWDRGYDSTGRQVWGADRGPYEFVRRPQQPQPQQPAARRVPPTDGSPNG